MIEILSRMPNKQFIFTCLNILNKTGKLTEKNINLLTNRDYCSANFLCRFAILSEVPTLDEVSKDYYNDNSGHRRYYPEKYAIGEKVFIVTNHWYGHEKSNPDNRTPFMQWVMN
ncbi:hypothetical protein K9O30_02955 [Clostridium bowmanii]|uniref:hypothetical protein n=1 Tax=Clostridium bowmanii TaxID=132925 RepID=UPI001C0CCA14|nr:hypothetical protein [Clostridium bowmanii]MBU3188324.1 hypothetical protein [Clostridium bowmanii]MCA1072712.1 hypothetical protein [Clostridium bowmanii]